MKATPGYSKNHLITASALLGLAVLYWLLRRPLAPLSIPFYDDGETLYHTFSILMGRTPFLEDANHHFIGYLLPYLVLSKIFGFGEQVLYLNLWLHRIGSAFVLYFVLRLFRGPWVSFLGAALLLSAREPWVLGVPVQYQMNFLWLLALYGALRSFKQQNAGWLFVPALLAGLALVYDQRALALVVIPFLAVVLYDRCVKRIGLILATAMLGVYLLPPLLFVGYLYTQGAFEAFIEQTFTYPAHIRAGAFELGSLLGSAFVIHRHLYTQTPILLSTGVAGFVLFLLRYRSACTQPWEKAVFWLLLILLLPLAGMASIGGRDFDYYTITWLPYLALFSAWASHPLYFQRRFLRHLYCGVLVLPILLSVGNALRHYDGIDPVDSTGDGVHEVVYHLSSRADPEDTVFVWGYRPDVYVRLKRLNPYRFTSHIFFHPDVQITENRDKYVFPKYEAEFIQALTSRPPDFLVIFEREGVDAFASRSGQVILGMLQSSYRVIHRTRKQDFTSTWCSFSVYTLLEQPRI